MRTETEAPVTEPLSFTDGVTAGATAPLDGRCAGRRRSTCAPGEVVGGGRPIGLRQVDPAGAGGRPAGARRRRVACGARRRRRRGLRLHAPARPAAALARRAGQRRAGARVRGRRRAPRPAGGRRRCSSASAWPSSSARGPPRCRAACASASPSCARCCPAGRCCCSTSRSARSTRSRARRCSVARRGAGRRAAHGPAGDPRRRGGRVPRRPRGGAVARGPGRVVAELEVPIPRPRDRRAAVTDPELARLRAQALEALRVRRVAARRGCCWPRSSASGQRVASLDSVDDLTLASPAETGRGLPRRLVPADGQRVGDALRGAARAWRSRSWPGVGARSRCTSVARCATPPTRCSSARRRSRSWCWRRSSCSPSTTGSGPSWPSSR